MCMTPAKLSEDCIFLACIPSQDYFHDNCHFFPLNLKCAPFQYVKCGHAGRNFPEHVFPAMVGRPIIRSQAKVGDIEVKVCKWNISFYMLLSVKTDNTGQVKFDES